MVLGENNAADQARAMQESMSMQVEDKIIMLKLVLMFNFRLEVCLQTASRHSRGSGRPWR